jgi:hypothetical protein
VIFDLQFNLILKSGLYDECKEINIGAVLGMGKSRTAKDEESLRELKSEYIDKYDKVKLISCRDFKPGGTGLGEGETILRMTEFAKTKNDKDIYLFFHSKGVTEPPDKSRSQFTYFYDRGAVGNADEVREFILRDMSEELISKWKEKVNILTDKQFYYYIWNFFWIKGSLLKTYDYNNYKKYVRFIAKANGCTGRQFTAGFPLGLYGAINRLDYKELYMFDDWREYHVAVARKKLDPTKSPPESYRCYQANTK